MHTLTLFETITITITIITITITITITISGPSAFPPTSPFPPGHLNLNPAAVLFNPFLASAYAHLSSGAGPSGLI